MAFPWAFEENFEDGTLGNFNSETDTGSRLDFPHYATTAIQRPYFLLPWSGAYCMRVNLGTSTADAYVQENDGWDVTVDSETLFTRFMLYVTDDVTMANNNEFAIWQLASTGPAVECGVYINYTTANGLRLGIGEGSASQFADLSTGVWHTVEVKFVPGSSSDSTLDAWLDGTALTQVGSFTSATTVEGYLGVVGQDAGTTAGTLLFDAVVSDDARVFPPVEQRPKTAVLTKSGHAFVGRGCINQVSLISTGTLDGVLEIYDTDNAYTSDESNLKCSIRNADTSDQISTDIELRRGCYVSLSGTGSRAIIEIARCPTYYSLDLMRAHARTRDGSTDAG